MIILLGAMEILFCFVSSLSHFFIVFAAFILSLRKRKSHSRVPEIESSFTETTKKRQDDGTNERRR